MVDSLEFRVKMLEDRIDALEAAAKRSVHSSPYTTVADKQQSPKEFVLTKTPKSGVQKTLVLAYYFEVIAQHGAFNSDDLEAIFRAAKEKLPANINDMVNKNIQKGYLMEDADKKNNKKAWVLTATGEKCVNNNFHEE